MTPHLSDKQLDRFTGTIQWPDELKKPEYARDRAKADDIVKTIIAGGYKNEELSVELKSVTKRMWSQAKISAKSMGFKKYIALRKFLTSLGSEGQFEFSVNDVVRSTAEEKKLLQTLASGETDERVKAIEQLAKGVPTPRVAAGLDKLLDEDLSLIHI